MTSPERQRVQAVVRMALIALVLAWLFSEWLRARLPVWLPLSIVAAFEIELVVRAWWERRTPAAPVRERAGPGVEDADLGWGEVVETEDGVEWLPPPRREPAPARRRWLGVATIAAAAVLVAMAVRDDARRSWQSVPADDRAATEARLTREAATIAGRPVVLDCDERYAFTGARSDALGVAFPARGVTYLHPSVCRALHDVLGGDVEARPTTAEALVVLAHEAVHLRGERRESVTECLALQEGVALGERLGIPTARAATMMRERYVRDLADRSLIRLEYQLPAECRDGGGLDVNPGSSRFP
ncbi:MAG: hypothetical protein ACRC50_02990 [Gaiella sp.]